MRQKKSVFLIGILMMGSFGATQSNTNIIMKTAEVGQTYRNTSDPKNEFHFIYEVKAPHFPPQTAFRAKVEVLSEYEG